MAMRANPAIRTPARIGAGLFALWSVLHIYVGVAGAVQFATGDVTSLWTMLIGGSNAPVSQFVFPTDAITANAQAHLLLNFCLDVGAFGVLGLFVAWMIWARASWTGYFIGLVAIGICDLSFTFALVTSGIIELSVATVAGPIIWVVAVVLTPFGMPALTHRATGAPMQNAASSADQNAPA